MGAAHFTLTLHKLCVMGGTVCPSLRGLTVVLLLDVSDTTVRLEDSPNRATRKICYQLHIKIFGTVPYLFYDILFPTIYRCEPH